VSFSCPYSLESHPERVLLVNPLLLSKPPSGEIKSSSFLKEFLFMSVTISTVDALRPNNGQWQPRQTVAFTCPSSGKVVFIRRPGPELTLRAGRVIRTFTQALKREAEAAREGVKEGDLATDFGLNILDKLSDEELAAVVIFARELVCAMLVSPKLVLNPKPSSDEIGPDDIGDDFWPLFNYGMAGFFNLKIPVGKEEEVTVSDLESFRGEPSVSGNSDNGGKVRADAEQPIGDSGLDGSA
jgi:hypothetical protein